LRSKTALKRGGAAETGAIRLGEFRLFPPVSALPLLILDDYIGDGFLFAGLFSII
jgi:hypothetical protein